RGVKVFPTRRSSDLRELDPILATRTTAEWLAVLGAADIPCGPVRTREQALRDPDARGLGLVVPLEDPRLGATWQPGAPALFSDRPEEHTSELQSLAY